MENKTQELFDNLAQQTIQITSQALHEKDLIIKDLKQKLANCHCQEVKNA